MAKGGTIDRSPKNPLRLWLGGAMIVLGVLAVGSGVVSLLDGKSRIIAPRGQISAEIADDAGERQNGLSNRKDLAPDAGMLFVFDDSSDQHCFWMKDTLIPLDMIWLDESKNVVTIRENVQPDSYPQSFCPDRDAKYVLEVNAGRASQLGIKENVELRF